jgi:hypothetical protein
MGEWKFPECHVLLRVPNIGNSGKNCTRGREASPSALEPMALEEEGHSGKALFPECNPSGKRGPRRRKELEENENILQRLFTKCLPLALGEDSLFAECLPPALGKGSLPRVLGESTRGIIFLVFLFQFFCESIPHYLKLLVQIWGNFKLF